MIQVDVVDQSITALIRYGVYKQENIGTIIHIRESETIITFIPRDVSNYIQHTFSILNTQNIVGY